MNKEKSDIEARIRILPTNEGGRVFAGNFLISKYYPIFKFNNRLNDVFLKHSNDSYTLKNNDEVTIGMHFKFPCLQIGRLSAGDKFELTEGIRPYITGTISNVLNPVLDREIWHNNQSRSIENLEKDKWPDLEEYPTSMVEKCHQLRKLPLGELTNEQLRLSVAQNVGMKFIVSTVISKLIIDKFLECDFYPGDLMQTVLRNLDKDWGDSEFLKFEFVQLCKIKSDEIENNEEVPKKAKREIFEIIENFKKTRDNML